MSLETIKEITVWYKLDGDDRPHSIKLRKDDTISGFKDAVKKAWSNKLQSIDAGDLRVFASAASPNSDIELFGLVHLPPTTFTNTLIITLPQQQPPLQPSSMVEFFKTHRHNCGNCCVLCYNIYHSFSEAAAAAEMNNNHVPVADTFKTQVTLAANDKLRNYFIALAAEGRQPDIENILSNALPEPSSLFDENDTIATAEKKKNIRKFFYTALYMDVRSKKVESTKDKLKGYFNGFYINLLRQLLKLDGFTCDQGEKKLIDFNTTDDRKVDLVVRDNQERIILILINATNETKSKKITSHRGKVAMELYHGWKADTMNCFLNPPLGVLVYPSESTSFHHKTCVFDVYTMKQVGGVICLITLDVFVAPIDSVDVTSRRQAFKECRNFDGSLPDDVKNCQRNAQLFVAACDGINRIVEACNALKKQSDDNRTAESGRSTTMAANTEGHGGGSGHSSGGGLMTFFRVPGGIFSQTDTETVPAHTPMKRKSSYRDSTSEQ